MGWVSAQFCPPASTASFAMIAVEGALYAMLMRFAGAYVVGIGTFPKHSSLFFYRGHELHDSCGLLRGGGRTRASSPSTRRVTRKPWR